MNIVEEMTQYGMRSSVTVVVQCLVEAINAERSDPLRHRICVAALIRYRAKRDPAWFWGVLAENASQIAAYGPHLGEWWYGDVVRMPLIGMTWGEYLDAAQTADAAFFAWKPCDVDLSARGRGRTGNLI